MQWTFEQRRAIEMRNTNILLSAAAGSGKTTVLVSRVLELISEGARIDRMLIVTFTRAASADMRAKLKRELGKRAGEGDENCRTQQLLMERASITTLHGFCSDFLRTHFEAAGVDPAFRVMDDAETRRLLDEALDAALEEAYAAPSEEMLALDYARGPKQVRGMAELLVRALDERPDPEGWLRRASRPDAELKQAWLNALVQSAQSDIDRAILLTRMGMDHPGCNGNYYAALEMDLAELKRLREIGSYDALYRALSEYKQAAVGRKRDVPIDEEVKKLRLDAKAAVDKIAMRSLDLSTALADVTALSPALEALGGIALRVRALFDARKAELSALSYSDLEHRTLAALREEDTARSLREDYDYVFVDEYQDTSDVQGAIISRIVRGDNLFMVGDVKQSIYRFRQAEPRLFLEKYESYGRGEGGALLPLTRNFRSRPGILDFVNGVFERAMYGGESEIVYDELARLNPGNPELAGGEVELHLIEAPEAADEAAQELNACEREALFIAGRIRELMQENPELQYRDFAILTRARRGILGRMAAILTQQGIPAFADGSEEFFDSVEVALALSLLKLTANRRSDVELIGVLRSPVVGLSDEELSCIRIASPDVPFVDAALEYAKLENDTARQLRDFFGQLETWRLMSLCSDLGILARRIFEESGLADCAGALPGGAQRRANLERLCMNAAAFDQSISGSLTRFLAHLEKLREKGDGDSAHVLGENDDVVRLMTVHKSKGLEFPVVFGAMLGRKYSSGARAAALTVHRDLGIGCLYCDPKLQSRRKTLPQLAIAECEKRQDRAEELRVLYVLLTRARDRLILSGSVKSAAALQMKAAALRSAPGAAGSHLEVILASLDEDFPVQLHAAPMMPLPEAIEVTAPAGETDPALLEALRWSYPDEQAARQPLKLTVTGLLRELHAPDAAQELIERPAFLSETAGRMTGAERGTAYHRVMQGLQFAALRGLSQRALTAEIRRQVQEMTDVGRITPVQQQAVYVPALAQFFIGETGVRLLAAETLQREWPFNLRMRISEALTQEEADGFDDEEILVQGAIDCCFMENGKWVLLDYKTDRSDDAAALTVRYCSQLRMYALALERITGTEVAEIRLCLLRAGESILIPRNPDEENV